jgi:nitrogen-specific signal transduction histidine kinase
VSAEKKKRKDKPFGIDLYKNKSTFNWLVVSLAVVIGAGSIIYTRNLVEALKEREQQLIELYAKTVEYTANEPNAADLTFVIQEIMLPNNSIPVILADGSGRPLQGKNLDMDPNLMGDQRLSFLRERMKEMEEEKEPLMLTFRDEEGEVYDYNYVYYENSALLKKLEYYPHVQLSVIAIFGLIVLLAFNYSKAAEQNRVWVGLAKETAHQLGTPISSLIAWIEYLKTDVELENNEVVTELEKDIHRLEMITARFSNIGSVPVLDNENVVQCIEETVNYLKKRLSKKVDINVEAKPCDIRAKLNKPLFGWVIENLCKNAVDSMGGIGKIDIRISHGMEDRVVVDICDTGKGIPKSKIRDVFVPGYTTKKRGWGLGLTLVKRIVDHYHEGRIYVKYSEIERGTTFRILLKS